MRDKYFQFERVDDNITELFVYGDIREPDIIDRWFGDDEARVDAFSFKDALQEVDTPNLVVRINSSGGEVNQGLAIYSLLKDFKGHLITKIDGWACSAASVIFMAGEERIMPESALIMIHNAWMNAVGDSNELRKQADDLEMITQPSVNIYVEKTGLSEETVKSMMDDETWMDYKKAFELGFATSIEKDGEAQQSIKNVNRYIKNLVARNSELESRNEELELLFATKNKEEIKNKEIEEKDPWESFLNL